MSTQKEVSVVDVYNFFKNGVPNPPSFTEMKAMWATTSDEEKVEFTQQARVALGQ